MGFSRGLNVSILQESVHQSHGALTGKQESVHQSHGALTGKHHRVY